MDTTKPAERWYSHPDSGIQRGRDSEDDGENIHCLGGRRGRRTAVFYSDSISDTDYHPHANRYTDSDSIGDTQGNHHYSDADSDRSNTGDRRRGVS